MKRNFKLWAFILTVIFIIVAYTYNQAQKKSKNMQDDKSSSTQNTSTNSNEDYKDWPESSKKAIDMMIKKYGQPNEKTSSMMMWVNNGPWIKTIVYKEQVKHNFPKPHFDVLQQFINYKLPTDLFSNVGNYDGSVLTDRTKGILSSRCDQEPMNFLALNLANEIVNGKKNVDEARKFYAKTAIEFMAGKTSSYTSNLMFNPQSNANTADPDESLMAEGAKGAMNDEVK